MTITQMKARRAVVRKREVHYYRVWKKKARAVKKCSAAEIRKYRNLYLHSRKNRRAWDKKIKNAQNVKTVSAAGVNLVARFEGFVGHAYKPVAAERYWTIGYGHYGPDVRRGATISQKNAKALLKKDLNKFAKGVKSRLHRKPTQNEFDAMVSFAYNVGLGAFGSSTLLRKFNAGDKMGAANEFGKWTRGASGPLRGLVIRRAAERKLFLK